MLSKSMLSFIGFISSIFFAIYFSVLFISFFSSAAEIAIAPLPKIIIRSVLSDVATLTVFFLTYFLVIYSI